MGLMASDLKEQLPEGPFVPVLHSFGLRPMMSLLREDPEMCSHILIEDSLPELSEPGYLFLSSVLKETPRSFPSRDTARRYFEERHGAGVLSRFLLSNLGPDKKHGPKALAWRFDPEALLALLNEARVCDDWDVWADFPGKTDLIVGADSDVVDGKRLEEAQARRSGKALAIKKVPDCGHWVHYEAPTDFENWIIESLGV